MKPGRLIWVGIVITDSSGRAAPRLATALRSQVRGSSRAVSLRRSLRLRGPRNAGEPGVSAHTAVVPFDDRGEASLHAVTSCWRAPLGTKIPYPSRWLARRALLKLRASGREVRWIHPCFAGHPGSWHVTTKKPRGW